jgi:hypothetical protein
MCKLQNYIITTVREGEASRRLASTAKQQSKQFFSQEESG